MENRNLLKQIQGFVAKLGVSTTSDYNPCESYDGAYKNTPFVILNDTVMN